MNTSSFPSRKRIAGTLISALLLVSVCPSRLGAQEFERALDAPGTVLNWGFSDRVATDGNLAAICMSAGMLTGGVDVGLVFVYDLTTGALVQTVERPTSTTGFGQFGTDAEFSDGQLLVSFFGESGMAWVVDPATGNALHSLTAPDGTDGFGAGLALDGDLAAVNAIGYFASSTPGKVFVFDLAHSTHVIIPAPAGFPDHALFGSELALAGDVLAAATASQGRVDVYDAPTGASLYSLDGFPVTTGVFSRGLNLAFGKGVMAVGSPNSDVGSSAGAGKVFLYDAQTGALLRTLDPPTPHDHGAFGFSVALAGGRVMVGEPLYSAPGGADGSVHVFDVGTGKLLNSLVLPVGSSAKLERSQGADSTSGSDANDGPGSGLSAAGAPTQEGAPSDWFGRSLAASEEHVVVGSLVDLSPQVQRGRAFVYSAPESKLRVLAIGIDDSGAFVPLRGDKSAELVGEAFQAAFDLPDEDVEIVPRYYDSTNPLDGFETKEVIEERIAFWRDRVQSGDTFVFYLGTHGAYEDDGDEVPVFVTTSLLSLQGKETTGDEVLLLGTDGDYLTDDALHGLFAHPDWAGVNKLFVIDACMSGGFWGTTADGDTGDLASLPRSALVAASTEQKFSYSFPPTGITYLAYALSDALDGLATGGALETLSFADLKTALLAQQGVMLDSFSNASGDFEGIITGRGPADLSPLYETIAPAELPFFASSTTDFALSPGGEPLPAPHTIRVPKDVADLQQALSEAGPGDTIIVKKGTFQGPLVIENKQGLTLIAKGTRLVGRGLIVGGSSGVSVRGLRVEGVEGAAVSVSDSSGVVIERCRLSDATGSGVDVQASDGVRLDRLKLQDVAGDGIVLGGAPEESATAVSGLVSSSQALRCKLVGVGGNGITLAGLGNTASRCKLVDVEGLGLGVPEIGSQNVFERNAVLGAGGDGLMLAGSEQSASRNRVSSPGAHGLVLAGDGSHSAERNVVSGAGGHGFDVSSPGSTLTSNRTSASAGFGFTLHDAGSGNTLTGNKAVKDAEGPLSDAAGGNTYDGNSFDGP